MADHEEHLETPPTFSDMLQPRGSKVWDEADTQLQERPQSSDVVLEVDTRRSALRQAGLDDLERAMQARDAGGDPFAATAHTEKKSRPRRPRKEKDDPDVQAFGQLFDSSKVYVYMALFVACTAVSPVLIKGSLYSMQTPAVLLFLHMLVALLMLWISSSYDVFTLNQLTLQGLKGCAVQGTLWALQMLCVFSALHHNSVIFVLTWTLLGRELVRAAAGALGNRQPVDGDVKMVLAIGAGAAGIEILLDSDKVWVGFLMMGVWTALAAVEAFWKHLKTDPSLGGKITNFRIVGLLRDLSDEEDALTPPNTAFLHHAVPAVPILILGFIALEGRELVNHELSVPAVTLMLLACAAHMTAVGAGLLLEGKVQPSTRLTLQAVATLGTILLYFLEEIRTISWAAVLCCTVACMSSYGAGLLKKQ